MRKHGFSSPFPHAHNLFTQFDLTLALPNPLSSPLPPSPPLSCPRLHQMIFTTKYVRVRLTNIKCFFVTYVTQDIIWSTFSHPLPPSLMEPGNVPYASRATSYPTQQHDTFKASPSFPHSRFWLWLKCFLKKWLPITNPRFRYTHYHLPKKNYFQTLPREFVKRINVHTYHEGSEFKTQV